jgi:DNA-binding NtrC family response regulator
VASIVVLMMEEEQPEGLSARKLVVETAKHNVLTAYNLRDGLNLLHRFPNVDVILVHSRLLEEKGDLLSEVKRTCPGKPIILATPFAGDHRPEADFIVDSHKPHDLVKLFSSGELQPRPC